MTEKQLYRKFKEFLQENGIYFVKYWGGGRFTRAGVPDLLCCVDGRFWGVELKTCKGVLSELQKREIEKIIKSGGVAKVVTPHNFEEVKSEILKNI